MFVPVTFMFSRPLASHFLRRSLLASSRTFAPARHLPKYVRLNSSSTDSPASGGKPGAVGSGKVSLDAWAPPILTYEQVKPKTEQPSPDSYLIDVREPEEVIQGSIPSSVNIPLSVLPASLYMRADEFEQKFGFKKPRRDQEIIFYCRSGVRAATAGDIAKKNGYEKLYNYRGSWLEWVQKEGHRVGGSST